MANGTNLTGWLRWPLAALGIRGPSSGRRRTAPTSAAAAQADLEPFESAPSPVAYALYADPARPPPGAPDLPPSAASPDTPTGFGFPDRPAVAGTDADGTVFDTTAASLAADFETIHYRLQFGGRTQPYRLVHVGEGTYESRGGVMEFEWSDDERFQELDAFLVRGHPYRITVNDVVQLEAPGGRFDWSVSRADVVDVEADEPVVALLYVVWRVGPPGGPEDPDGRGRPGVAVTEADGPRAPAFPPDLTPSVHGLTIDGTAERLTEAPRAPTEH